jgi:hypothetical protein
MVFIRNAHLFYLCASISRSDYKEAMLRERAKEARRIKAEEAEKHRKWQVQQAMWLRDQYRKKWKKNKKGKKGKKGEKGKEGENPPPAPLEGDSSATSSS